MIVFLIETRSRIKLKPVLNVKHIKHIKQKHASFKARQAEGEGIESLKPLDNAHMGDEKGHRIDGAFSGLIKNLIPSLPDEDKADAEERLRHAVQFGKSILHRYKLCPVCDLVSC